MELQRTKAKLVEGAVVGGSHEGSSKISIDDFKFLFKSPCTPFLPRRGMERRDGSTAFAKPHSVSLETDVREYAGTCSEMVRGNVSMQDAEHTVQQNASLASDVLEVHEVVCKEPEATQELMRGVSTAQGGSEQKPIDKVDCAPVSAHEQ